MKTARKLVSVAMPTKYGRFCIWVWNDTRGQERIALTTPNLDPEKEVVVRIHSECLTGDSFGSLACDCGMQKAESLRQIAKHGNGVFIYHRQEGRNMGLFKKICAYNLMHLGMDTHEANIALTGKPDAREYSSVISILDSLLKHHRSQISLLSNNPYKRLVLERERYPVIMSPLSVGKTVHNAKYSQTKEQKFLHYPNGYRAYAGITIHRSDLKENRLKNSILRWQRCDSGRSLFLGIGLSRKLGELKYNKLANELNSFSKLIGKVPNLSLVLHLPYSILDKFNHDLRTFLKLLKFQYSVQLRFEQNAEIQNVNLKSIKSLHAEHLIFQIRKSQYTFLGNPKIVNLFRAPNHYLLLDDSWGLGKQESFNTTKSKVMSVIKTGISHIAIAGGYHSGNLHKLTKLEDFFKIPISVDAETKLRDHTGLNFTKVKNYLDFYTAKKKHKLH